MITNALIRQKRSSPRLQNTYLFFITGKTLQLVTIKGIGLKFYQTKKSLLECPKPSSRSFPPRTSYKRNLNIVLVFALTLQIIARLQII